MIDPFVHQVPVQKSAVRQNRAISFNLDSPYPVKDRPPCAHPPAVPYASDDRRTRTVGTLNLPCPPRGYLPSVRSRDTALGYS